MDGSAPPVTITDWDEAWDSLAWLNDNELLVISDQSSKLRRLSAGTGRPSDAIKIDMGSISGFVFPSYGNPVVGDHSLFLNVSSWGPRGWHMDQWLLDTNTGKAQRLLENAGNAVYSPTGNIVFTRGESLMAAPFDTAKLAITGEVTALADGVRVNDQGNHGPFEISSDGNLIYPAGGRVGTDRQLLIVDTAGAVTPFTTERRTFDVYPRISPDGRRAAVVVPNQKGTYETWVADLGRPGLRRILALPNADCENPLWSPDGQWLAYTRTAADKDDGVYVQRADGTGSPRAILMGGHEISLAPTSWSSDGSHLLVLKLVGGKGDVVFADVPVGGGVGPSKDLVASPANEGGAVVSRDGRLIAFSSDETGKFEIYVAPFNTDGQLGQKVQVSIGASPTEPNGFPRVRWAADSRHLFYYKEPNKLMAVTIETKPSLSASAPTVAYDFVKLRVNPWAWDIMPDGRLLAIQRGEGEDDVSQYNVVINWATELRQRMAKGK